MPVIVVNDQQYSLRPGQTRVGGGAGVDVPVGTDDRLGVQAIVDVQSETQVVIRRAGAAAAVRVNGVPLGVEPTLLMHGDKLDIAGVELLYSDDRKEGATQYVAASDVAALVQKRPGGAGGAGTVRPTAATGGRLVSLVDGKEYSIDKDGITIGREAGSDVVVAQSEVSRRHARIVPVDNGYMIEDYSANGVFVNGAKVLSTQLLSRADVVRVGSEEFRFYADIITPPPRAAAAAPTPPAPAPAAPATPVVTAPTARPAASSAPAPGPASSAPSTEPAAAPTDTRPVLAELEIINEGVSKGKRYEIRVPLAHVGRGAHNEVVIADDSVSDSHAKLQRRDEGWFVVDLGSTNGTYVGGTRITGERKLEGAPNVRFGGVKLVFRAQRLAGDEVKGTRAIVVGKDIRERAKVNAAPAAAPAKAGGGVPAWVWIAIVVVVAAAGALFFVKR